MTSPSTGELCERVLELVGRAEPSAEAEVTASAGRSSLTRFANSFIHQNVGEEGPGVLLRVVLDGRGASMSTNVVSDEGLERLVDTALAAARLRPVDPDWPGLAPSATVSDIDHFDDATAAAEPAERAAVVKAFVEGGPGLRGAGYCDTEAAAVTFLNSAGQRAEGRFSRATLDGIHQTATSAGKGHQTSVRLADLDGAAIGAVAADKATAGTDAGDLEPGRYEVVLEPECTAEMLAFLAFYGFNAKQVIEEQSFVELGARQFDPSLTVVDDATDQRAVGLAFDTEGTPKRRVELVREGESVGLAHDRRTAHKLGVESTAHAVPGGESFGAFPSNLFLAAGPTSVDDMVGSMDRGLLITEFNYCRILDPKTQVVTGLTRNGTFLVEGGRIVRALKNLRFTQSFVEALAPGAVKAVGDDARFAAAEFGVGIVHAPSVHLASWNFTGGARG